ncbi:MAG TPA: putative O-glycosylation ligase, exosortase A system-associated [Thiobacillus sp.]|nr:MAG: putative O-glycosylation ligase, exosortase A system-associated [Hydrogenophilales bacterium 16-64-40]OZA35018.1 MAG: putative O-glycosylation ligase, exosortase A system-associated [Hydrogenophilales bacterium 17-64-65]HQS80863.1 putative O-glycosylation ligase, exosortase A system-associated [Thiobacillus sp.]HQT33521.1 putative O-glycosylation ligase, exosortase A system-associated [Thiobacillus sp.]
MRDILVTAIVFGVLPFIFKRPWVGIMLWCWLAYMNPHRQAWGFAYDMPFAFITAIVTITAFMFSKEKKGMIWTRETILLLMFIGWMLLTTYFAFYSELAWDQWSKVWRIQLMVFLTAMIIKERQHLNWMIWVIALSLGYYGVKGGIFTIMHGGQFRVQGPAGTFFGGNNEMALVLAMLVPLIRYLHLQASQQWVRWGLASAMVLSGIAAIGSQSRGGLLAMAAMGFFLWFKSRHKLVMTIYMAIAVAIMASVMPQEWYDRMDTIKTYEEDDSALGRINAWHTAFNVAKARVTGGGFEMFRAPTFRQYAPEPFRVHDVHSIYFEVMGEHGFIGFGMFILLAVLVWLRANQVIRECKNDLKRKWAADLAAMIQVSLVGYGAGGLFLGLAYFDLTYHLMIVLILAAKFSGVLDKTRATPTMAPAKKPPPHPSSKFGHEGAGRRI